MTTPEAITSGSPIREPMLTLKARALTRVASTPAAVAPRAAATLTSLPAAIVATNP